MIHWPKNQFVNVIYTIVAHIHALKINFDVKCIFSYYKQWYVKYFKLRFCFKQIILFQGLFFILTHLYEYDLF